MWGETMYEEYANIFKALSDPTRLKIINMLAKEDLCACKILEEFNITQPTLSYHMKTLIDSTLVTSTKEGPWVTYSINKEKKQEIINFLERN